MIFVTVGTHEQPFNRLIEEVDKLKGEGIILDDVFIQTGFSTYEPRYCEWKRIISYSEMEKYMDESEIIITHGGPATFMSVIAKGKKPIVVPRRVQFGEHVNDHQLEFAKQVFERFDSIFVVENVDSLKDYLTQELSLQDSSFSNNKKFNYSLQNEIESLVK
jgi:UDP-N-acetylglucosamine transferase subunit ALG13